MRFSCEWLSELVEIGLPEDRAGSRAWDDFIARISRDLTFMGHAVEDHELDPGEDLGESAPDDLLLDVDVTTNRVDAMGHLGLARDLSALYDRDLKPPAAEPEEASEPTSGAIRVAIEDPRCSRFAARVVRGVKVEESPAWLKRRLRAVGARPINNVVDVTNYVLWELGKPIHAYDLATLRGAEARGGAEIRVRASRDGEELVTLDGERRRLDPGILVIADGERAVGIGGVIGGLETEVTSDTVDVLIESAHFEPRALRRGARQLGLHTDASHRFERGVDPEVCALAASRAAHLIREVAGGAVLSGVVDIRFDPEAVWRLEGTLVHSRLEAFLGVDVEPGKVERWLSRLGFELTPREPGAWRVKVPSWRFYDFQPLRPDGNVWEADLFEEVARLHGLENIPSALPALAPAEPPPTAAQHARRRAADHLVACGYAEAITFAFGDPGEGAGFPSLRGEGPPLALANPLSERYSVMRRSLLPGLVESARFNQRRGAESVRLFEIGRVFFPAAREDDLPEEEEMVALVAGGGPGSPWLGEVELDFFDLKGAVESLAEALGTRLEARPASPPGFASGAAAELWIGDGRAGFLGRIAGEDDPYPLFAAEVALAALRAGEAEREVETPSRYPGVAVDLTLAHALDTPWQAVRRAIEERRPADLVSFALKDRYRGEGVPDGAVATTIAFFYNSPDRSLTQEEVNERHRDLAAELERRFGWREGSHGD